MNLEQTWRWYGPEDPVSLQDARQAGATGIVTALHELPTGAVWTVEAIKQRQQLVEKAGLKWSVVESLNVHEEIKTGSGRAGEFLENYKQSIRNLGACGIRTVCYNFMPLLDATRTDFNFRLPGGAASLRFDWPALIAFDLFILERPGAAGSYSPAQQDAALRYYKSLSKPEKETLTSTIIAGFPNVGKQFTLDALTDALKKYASLDRNLLKENLATFLREVTPAAEEAGIFLTIHPDDPPYSLLGLPRIVSTEEDIAFLLEAADNPHNGICFCAGSFAASPSNDLLQMIRRFASRIHFVHLRNIIREENGSFYESDHLTGVVDMYRVMEGILEEAQRRQRQERESHPIPFRADHGLQILDDLHKKTIPGYSAIGRLRGLAELRGLAMGISGSKAIS